VSKPLTTMDDATKERAGVWRDDSPPAFTVSTPNGSHPAWWATHKGKDFGPYFTRHDATRALEGLRDADAPQQEDTK
jgi:hypothetical protein